MEIRLFKKDENSELKHAIHNVWSEGHILCKDDALLNYMFYENPLNKMVFGEDHYGFLGAWYKGEVIGLLGLIALNVNIGNHKTFGFAPTNWVVSKRYRKTGAGLLLMREMLKYKPSLVLNLGIPQNVADIYAKMSNYHVVQNVPRWIGVVNKRQTERLLLGGNFNPLRFYEDIRTVYSETSNHRISNNFSSEKWDEFYWGNFATRTNGFSRDSTFIKWRYFQHPSFQYQVFISEDSKSNYKGLLVVRIEEILNKTAKIGRIVEFIATDQDSAISLANKLVELGQSNNLLFLDFYCFSSASTWGLETVGFKRDFINEKDKIAVPSRFQPLDLDVTTMRAAMYVSKDIQKKISLIEDQNWYVTKGDADQDRPN